MDKTNRKTDSYINTADWLKYTITTDKRTDNNGYRYKRQHSKYVGDDRQSCRYGFNFPMK